jgi:hypothetical protein
MKMRALRKCFLLLFFVCCVPLFAQSKGSGGGQGGPSSQNGSQQGGSQQGGPQGNNASANGMGITGGGPSIESILFSYKALSADARAIAQEISDITNDQDLLVIVTPSDTSAFIQWRAVLQQIHLLQARTQARPRPADVTLPVYANVPQPAERTRGSGEAYVASSQDVQTLVQTLATMFAVNESASPAAGAITDVPLVNAIARDLSASRLNVYVPSLYSPDLFRRDDLTGTFIGADLQALERSRFDITSDIQQFQRALDTATLISKPDATPPYMPGDVTLAKNFLATRASEMKSLITSDTALVAAIDTFEASLFTGQSPATPTSSTNPLGAQGTQAQGAAKNPNQIPTQNPTQNPAQNNGSPVPALNFNSAPGSILQQILPADLLAYKIWQANTLPDDVSLTKMHILIVHALESGGTQLTKSNLFLGSRVYFSGGSVATFSLFNVTGAVECAGYAYDYSGYTREKNVETRLREPQSNGAIVETAFACN